MENLKFWGKIEKKKSSTVGAQMTVDQTWTSKDIFGGAVSCDSLRDNQYACEI